MFSIYQLHRFEPQSSHKPRCMLLFVSSVPLDIRQDWTELRIVSVREQDLVPISLYEHHPNIEACQHH